MRKPEGEKGKEKGTYLEKGLLVLLGDDDAGEDGEGAALLELEAGLGKDRQLIEPDEGEIGGRQSGVRRVKEGQGAWREAKREDTHHRFCVVEAELAGELRNALV